jgi:hypothetical protein
MVLDGVEDRSDIAAYVRVSLFGMAAADVEH